MIEQDLQVIKLRARRVTQVLLKETSLCFLIPGGRFELPTSSSTDWRSNQLSYPGIAKEPKKYGQTVAVSSGFAA